MNKLEIKKKAEEYAIRMEEEEKEKRRAEQKKERPRYNLLHPQSMTSSQRRNVYFTMGIVIILFVVFLTICSAHLIKDKNSEQAYWDSYMQDFDKETQAIIDRHSKNATEVEVAMDVEEIRGVDMKNSNFKLCMNVSYKWKGHDDWDFSNSNMVHFYKGNITSCGINEDFRGGKNLGSSNNAEVAKAIEKSGMNYQNVYYEVTISKAYWTPRFPLESHQLRFFITPSDNINQIIFKVNQDESYISDYVSIKGYDVVNFGANEFLSCSDKHMMNPVYENYSDKKVYTMEVMGQIEINASGIGTYIKCFIALFGTLAWILMCLYVCTYRRVDSLGLTGSAFFGAVSNIVVSASLLPDALQMGLVEYVNIFGIAIIITVALLIIRINNFRNERDRAIFARFYGKSMFWLLVVLVIISNLILPLSAWRML